MKKFFERDLEDIIHEYAVNDPDKLIERGLDCVPHVSKVFRQKRIGEYGICDLMTVEKGRSPVVDYNAALNITIFELKSGIICQDAFFQALRYARGVQRYLSIHRDFDSFRIEIVLIGDSVDTQGNFLYLESLWPCDEFGEGAVSGVRFYTYKYDFDGISFKQEQGYKLTYEGF